MINDLREIVSEKKTPKCLDAIFSSDNTNSNHKYIGITHCSTVEHKQNYIFQSDLMSRTMNRRLKQSDENNNC